MVPKILKVISSFHIIFEDEEGNPVGETITQPINFYFGQELTDEILGKIKELALQNFLNPRPS